MLDVLCRVLGHVYIHVFLPGCVNWGAVATRCKVVDRFMYMYSYQDALIGDCWTSREALRGGISIVNFPKVCQLLTTISHKNEKMAPRTRTGYPHEGPSVAHLLGAKGNHDAPGAIDQAVLPPVARQHHLRAS